MSLELSLLKVLLKRENHCKYFTYVSKLDLPPEITLLVNLINKYYERFEEHNYIAPDELAQYFTSQYPQQKEPKKYLEPIYALRTMEVSDSLAADILRKLTAQSYAMKLIGDLIPVAEGKADPELLFTIPATLQEYSSLLKDQDENNCPFLRYHPDELFGSVAERDGIYWPLNRLNQTVGPLARGSLGHVFARVEIGKTTFISQTMTDWARQLREAGSDQIVLGVFNEEKGSRVVERTYHSMLNLTPAECASYRESGHGQDLYEMFWNAGGDHLEIIHDTKMSLEKLIEILEVYKVRMLVIDIADHLKYRGDHKENEERRLNEIYRTLRQIADKYDCDILSCAQATDTAAGKKRLYLENMFYSKTAKPGALDYAIGIGHSYEAAEADFRWINVCKNKFGEHAHFTVQIDKLRGRYKELG